MGSAPFGADLFLFHNQYSFLGSSLSIIPEYSVILLQIRRKTAIIQNKYTS